MRARIDVRASGVRGSSGACRSEELLGLLSNATGMENGNRQWDRRWNLRRGVELNAEVTDSAGAAFLAKVIDISEEGCMLRTVYRIDFARDCVHAIKITGLEEIDCYVVWCEDHKAGVTFGRPLHSVTVQNLVMKSHYAKISRHMAQAGKRGDDLLDLPPFPLQ